MNNYNYAHQSPVSVHHNLEHRDIDDSNDEITETELSVANQSQIESDKRSQSSVTIEPLVSSTSNNLSPSPQDSPIQSDSQHEQFLNNHFFSDGKTEHIDDNLFELTPDQVQVIRELEMRQQEADYNDDYEYGLNFEDIPEYDVRAKILSLNAQLADEPFPPDSEHRNSKVVFRDDIVSLVIPADNDRQSDSEPDEPNFNTEVSGQTPAEIASETTYSSPVLLTTDNVPYDHKSEITPTEFESNEVKEPDIKPEEGELQSTEVEETRQTVSTERDTENQNMVVSRGGEFHVMGTGDIIDGSNHYSKNEDDKSSNDGEYKRAKSRPISASVSRRNNKDHGSNLDTGCSTKPDTNSRSSSLLQKQNDRSRLQIPRVDKEALRRQQERKKKEEEENMKREEEEQKMRKEMNTKSFNSWLQTKQKHRKEEDERKKKEEEEEKDKKEKLQDERKIIAEDKEKELTKKLENERKKEEKLRQYRLKEMEDSMIIHTKAECRKAYKDWLKKKHNDHQSKVKEDRQRARITRLAMRQCRKSQDLAQAIQQSSSFRYLDFCGYP